MIFRVFLAFSLIAISTVATKADALHRNPDQRASFANLQTFGRTSIPIGAYQYCVRYQERCKYAVKSRKLKLTRENWKQLVETNVSINAAVRPVTDMDFYGVEEFWEIPTKAGDCEDYVLAKKVNLVKAGIPAGAMRVTVVFDENDGGHAVLTVVTDRGDYILDNNTDKVLPWQEAELTYIKRQLPGNLLHWESLRPQG